MTEKLLTKSIISGCIAGTDNGEQNSKIVLILAIIMFATVILSPLGILCLVLRNKSKHMIQLIRQNRYVLQEDVVVNKYTSVSTDGPDSHYFFFEKTGKKEVNFPHAVLNSEAFRAVPDLYKTTEIGDTVYLLCTENGVVLYMFNKRFWKLNENEFFRKDDKFIPC